MTERIQSGDLERTAGQPIIYFDDSAMGYPKLTGLLDYYENLAVAKLNEHFTPQNLMEKLQLAQEQLQFISEQQNFYTEPAGYMDCEPEIVPAGSTLSSFNYDQVLELLEKQLFTSRYERIHAPRKFYFLWFMQRCQRVRQILLRIAKKLKALKCINHISEPVFCGLCWTQRTWFLLHGSHPPKTGVKVLNNLFFGCALA